MANVDTSDLENWPKTADIDAAAKSILNASGTFQDHLSTTKTEWGKLNDAKVISYTGNANLQAALNPCSGWAKSVADGGVLAANALAGLSGTMEELWKRRDQLEKAAAAANKLDISTSTPEDESDPNSPLNQVNFCQAAIFALRQDLDSAVKQCYESLWSIQSDGRSSIPTDNTVLNYARDRVIDATKALTWSLAYEGSLKSWSTSIRIGNEDFALPTEQIDMSVTSVRARLKLNFGEEFGESFWGDTWRIFKDSMAIGEAESTVKFSYKGSDVSLDELAKVSTKDMSLSAEGMSALGHGAAKILAVAGWAITVRDEKAKREDLLRHQDPNLTEQQIQDKSSEAGLVRGTTEFGVATGVTTVLTAMAVGAGEGSVAPGVGTLIGLGVGAVVGLAMIIPTGDGKSVADRIGDAGEAVWNWLTD